MKALAKHWPGRPWGRCSRYFIMQAVCGVIALATAMSWWNAEGGRRIHRWRVGLDWTGGAAHLGQLAALEPGQRTAGRTLFVRMSASRTPRKPISANFMSRASCSA